MFLESETSQFNYLPNCIFCENLSLVHLLTCCSSVGASAGKGVESAFSFPKEAPVSFMLTKHPWKADAPNMLPCVTDWTPETLAPGSYVSSITASLSRFPRREDVGIVEGLKRTLESESDISLVEKTFILRIISLQMVHTCELTKSPCFREILAKEEPGREVIWSWWNGKQTRKESELLFGKCQPLFQACCPNAIQSALAGVSWGVISRQKWGPGKTWPPRNRTNRPRMSWDKAL